MPPPPYQSPTGRHRHQCLFCDTVWEHANTCAGVTGAHHCPQCKTVETEWYEGEAAPMFQDHHLTHPPPVDQEEENDAGDQIPF